MNFIKIERDEVLSRIVDGNTIYVFHNKEFTDIGKLNVSAIRKYIANPKCYFLMIEELS